LIERKREGKKQTRQKLFWSRETEAGILFGRAKWPRKDMSVSKRSRRESGGNDAGENKKKENGIKGTGSPWTARQRPNHQGQEANTAQV
jgi:hypothetical protein